MRDSNRFYATAASGKTTWLVEGNIAERSLRVLRENVECPSLSPDQKRIAFKKRVGALGQWRLHVLDLASLEDAPLALETHNFDDQIEWLDDGHVLYGQGAQVWLLPTDGSAPPRPFVRFASSPSVVRSERDSASHPGNPR